jgi:cyclophilin family peptidyl-prolyl cis-trans isomerase
VDRNPKRARKKEARDLRVAAQEAAWRRRRYARIAAVVGVIGAVVVLMLYATAGGEDEGNPAAQPTEGKTPEDTPCPAADAPPSHPQQYDDKTYPALDQGVDYSALIRTTCGDIELDLAEDQASETVANFVFLAREGFYDGLTWHRILGGFVIQSGDPNGRNGEPPDGPGYTIPDELQGVKDKDYRYGTVAMANTGQPDTGGSQFFIVVHDRAGREPAGLDALYTIFGEVAKGSYDVIDDISRQPVKGGDDPVTAEQPKVPIYIETIEIRR